MEKIFMEYLRKENSFEKFLASNDAELKYISNRNSCRDRIVENSDIYIKKFADDFKDATRFDSKDMWLLTFATSLQCSRWFFQPKVNLDFKVTPADARSDSGQDGNKEKKESRQKAKEAAKNQKGSKKYPRCEEILARNVPFDVMKKTERIVIPGVSEYGKNLYSQNHHIATWGHDPNIGYIIGTANILTRTVTFRNPIFQTSMVELTRKTHDDPYHYTDQFLGVATDDITHIELVSRVYETIKEDPKRLVAAIAKEHAHLLSDENTKTGLPAGLIMLSPEKLYELLRSGFNNRELKRLTVLLAKDAGIVATQASLAAIVNFLIGSVCQMVYASDKDKSKELLEVKCKKIICYSQILAEGCNGLYAVVSKDIQKADFGGFIVALSTFFKNRNIIYDIRSDYVYGRYEKLLDNPRLDIDFSYFDALS